MASEVAVAEAMASRIARSKECIVVERGARVTKRMPARVAGGVVELCRTLYAVGVHLDIVEADRTDVQHALGSSSAGSVLAGLRAGAHGG